MRIIGPPSVPSFMHLSSRLSDRVKLPNVHERWVDVAIELWTAAEEYLIDPIVAIAQSAHETGWWNFPGLVKPGMRNTAGIRVHPELLGKFPETKEDQTFSHATFANWRDGALAQVQHLAAYTGLTQLPDIPIVDPRFELVVGAGLALETVEELGGPGRWAPNPDYGNAVAGIARRLQGR